jgi:hypothetical protein
LLHSPAQSFDKIPNASSAFSTCKSIGNSSPRRPIVYAK